MKRTLYFLIICTVMFTSCSNEKRHADISGIDLEIHIARFDSAFWMLDTTNLPAAFADLNGQYPDITPIYLEHILRFGAPDSAITHSTYLKFRNDSNVQHLYHDALTHYADISDIENSLTLAFRRAKYFFPYLQTPRLYTHLSGFNQNIISGPDFISLSIDNYLGTDYPVYQMAGIYQYQRINMHRGKIAPDFITAWLTLNFPAPIHANSNLLSDMIYHGKILYVTSLLLPDVPEHVIIGYTTEQWEWAKKYEPDMWGTLMQNKHLFATDMITRGRYTNDGPFTRPFTQESPSRCGAYIGWMIVEHYMEKNRHISPAQLMEQPDAQLILSQSNYRPK